MESSFQANAVIVSLSPAELAGVIRTTIDAALDERLSDMSLQSPQEEEEFLTRDEAKALLHVSYVTLRKYEKQGLLYPCRIGRRVLYRKADVVSALKATANGNRRTNHHNG